MGKSIVALQLSHLLAQKEISHALIEGDYLDLAYPEPWRQGVNLAEQNLAVVWRNYRAAGYFRLIYTNTVSVLEMAKLEEAIGGTVHCTGVLLTATDATARARLEMREVGAELDAHVERGARAARQLNLRAPDAVHRVRTDNRSVDEVARELLSMTQWDV